MRTVAFVAALVAGASALPQAVTSNIAPQEATPSGCKTSYDGTFQVVVQKAANQKRSLFKRQSTPLEIQLKDGVLTDAMGRTGYIASNNQFQFDGPAQAGAIYTAGWSVCANNSIALGDSTIFYQCLSGNFYNLYDENSAEQCSPVYLQALAGSTSSGASAQADGQVTGAAQQADGQVTAASAQTAPATHTVVCQIGDGQIQQNTCVTTATPVAEATDGQVTAPQATGNTVTQISDGQIQAPTGSAPAATTQAPSVTAPVVQAPTGATVTQISDGQIQAPTAASNGTAPSSATPSSPAPFTGAAAVMGYKAEMMGLVAGVVALAAL